jgi:hypothetical protein
MFRDAPIHLFGALPTYCASKLNVLGAILTPTMLQGSWFQLYPRLCRDV